MRRRLHFDGLSEATLSTINILYVEDDTDIRDLAVELIHNEGRRVVACADAEAAWLHLQRETFDVLVTDVSLPGLSGTELAKRWLEGDPERRVILFSGHDFRAGVAGLGTHVRAIPKDDFEQLDQVLAEICEQLQRRAPSHA